MCTNVNYIQLKSHQIRADDIDYFMCLRVSLAFSQLTYKFTWITLMNLTIYEKHNCELFPHLTLKLVINLFKHIANNVENIILL